MNSKMKELVVLSVNDLKQKLEGCKKSLMEFRCSISPIKDTAAFSKLRKEIARIKTLLTQLEKNKK